MRTLGLVIGLVALASASCFAATATVDLYSGWQTVATPIVPFDPTPSKVFQVLDWEGGSPALNRWDNSAGGFVSYAYNYADGVDPIFGGVLLGEGYLVNPDAYTGSFTVTGVENGVPATTGGPKTDMWISLAKAGWALIGNPYAQDLEIDQDYGTPFQFTDGTTLKNWADAAAANWVAEQAMRYDATLGRWVSAGVNYGEEYSWLKGAGYILEVKQPNIAMIITAPTN